MAREVSKAENALGALARGMDVSLDGRVYRMVDGCVWLVGRVYRGGLDGPADETLLRCNLSLNAFLAASERISDADRMGLIGGIVLRDEAEKRRA